MAQQIANQDSREKKRALKIALVPFHKSDHPVFTNFTRVKRAHENVFVDFGYLKPESMELFARLACSGASAPKVLTGRLAVSVVMGYEAVVPLYRQLGKVIAAKRARNVIRAGISKTAETSVGSDSVHLRVRDCNAASSRRS